MQRVNLALVLVIFLFVVAGAGVGLAADPPLPPAGAGPDKDDSKVSPLLKGLLAAPKSGESDPTLGKSTRFAQSDSLPPATKRGLSQQLPSIGQPPPGRDSKLPEASPLLPHTPHEFIRFDQEGNVQVYIYSGATGPVALDTFEDLGARVEAVARGAGIVQAWVPISGIDAFAELDFVTRISLPDYADSRSGSVKSRGDSILRAGLTRSLGGFTGAGVKIGIISDGVTSMATAQATGDVPASIDIDPLRSGYGEEGTAMLEIVHDLAPGAHLAFSGPRTSVEMAESIRHLAYDAFGGTGVDIIVDDLGFWLEPYFADGIVAQAAAEVVDAGTIFVSAAGNSAQRHYEGGYVDGGDNYHQFGSDDTFLSVVFIRETIIFLQWNDEFGSSGNDYDLYACLEGYRPTGFNLNNNFCYVSGAAQDGDDYPFEGLILGYQHFGALAGDRIYLDVYIHGYDVDTVNPGQLEMFIRSGAIIEHGVPEGGIYGHSAVSGVLAVAAIDAAEPGHDAAEPYSDRGPSEVYFPSRETRSKPDISAIDGVAVTGSGGFSNPFFGTSAAAPHVAALAALVLEAKRQAQPGISKGDAAEEVYNTLRDTAVDLGDTGFDNVFGTGRADALAAIYDMGQLSSAVLTVDSTGDGADSNAGDGTCGDDSGNCTLRAAIQEANAGDGAIIEFNISGDGPHTIQPGSALPDITKPTVIDGRTQAGPDSSLAQIELDGTNAGTGSDGLTLTAQGSQVMGLAINRFDGNGIVLETTGLHVIEDNLIGTGTAGDAAQGNGGAGVSIVGISGNSLLRNVISGNGSHGVLMSGSGASGNTVLGNFIGTDAAGAADLGNTGSGVSVSGAPDNFIVENVISGNDSRGILLSGSGTTGTLIRSNYIGTGAGGSTDLGNSDAGIRIAQGASSATVELNTIAYNDADGVAIVSTSAAGNSVWENSIHSNTGLGIDLGDDGVTSNDTGDVDSGPNNLQNGPTITSAATDGDEVSILGTVSGKSNTLMVLDFYSNSSCDGTNNGEGQAWEGYTVIQTDNNGGFSFRASSLLRTLRSAATPVGTYMTATATAYLENDRSTSEFSNCVQAETLKVAELSAESITVDEGGSVTYSLRLAEAPAGLALTVALNTYDTTVVTVTPLSLTFTSGNWDDWQTITVNGVADTDATDDSLTLIHIVMIDNVLYVADLIDVTVKDDDLPQLTLSESSVVVEEESQATYTAELSEQPAADVTVSLISDDPAAASVSPASISFTTSNWNTAQTITVSGVSDDDGSHESVLITHYSTIGGEVYILDFVRVNVTDDELPELTLSRDSLSVDEGGAADYTVVLKEEPASTVTVNLETSVANVVQGSPATLIFTKDNWDDAQTVTLNGVQDDDGANETVEIWHVIRVNNQPYLLGTVTVSVTDDDPEPHFLEGSAAARSVAENSTQGTDVGPPVAATDPDGGTLTYTIAGVDSSLFSVDAVSGRIAVGSTVLDFEQPSDADSDNHYEVTLTATDSNNDTDSIDVTIEVTDDLEGALWSSRVTLRAYSTFVGAGGLFTGATISPDRFEFQGTAIRIVDMYLNTTGRDLYFCIDGNLGSYKNSGWTLHTPDTSFAFSNSTLDETASKDCYSWSGTALEWADGDTVALSLRDEPISSTSYAPPGPPTGVTVSQALLNPHARLTVSWTAPDNTGRQPITDHDYRFRVNGDAEWKTVAYSPIPSGPVVISDLESSTTYQVQVRAVNGRGPGGWSGSGSGTTAFLNSAPDFSADSDIRTVAENTAEDENVGAPVTATDPDNHTLTYSLGGADSNSFSINESTGQITVGTGTLLDYETTPSYTVEITATDTYDDFDSITITINVSNVDEAPEVSGLTDLSYAENATTTVATYTASDPEGAAISGWALSGEDSGDFLISDSGVLTFASAPDYEGVSDDNTDNVYLVTVEATDQTGNTGTLDVTVTVTNVNETPLAVADEVSVDEDGSVSVPALDNDSDPEPGDTKDTLSLSLATDPSHGTASVVAGSGAGNDTITYAPNANFNGTDSFTYTVTDAGGLTSSTATVTVTVNPVNDPPEFQAAETGTRTLDENTPSGVNIGGPVGATDLDTGDTLTYTKTNIGVGTDAGAFDIDRATGQLTTKGDLNFETKSSYTFTVTVTDASNTSTSIQVTITLADVDDPPRFDGDSTVRVVSQYEGIGHPIGEPVSAIDEDSPSATLVYALGGVDAALFALGASSGQLSSAVDFDYETQTSYALTVSVSDGKGGSDTIAVTVAVYVPLDTTTTKSRSVTVVNPVVDTPAVTPDQKVEVTLPANTVTEPVQVVVDSDATGCESDAPAGTTHLCATVELYDSGGDPLTGPDATLNQDSPAVLEFRLSQDEVIAGWGSATGLRTANAAGRVKLMTRSSASSPWKAVPFTLTITGDNGAELTASVNHFSQFTVVTAPPPPPPRTTPRSSGVDGGGDDDNPYRPPGFIEGTGTTREVPENSLGGSAVGDPVAALSNISRNVFYSKSGPDADLFDLSAQTGQIFVAEGANLDHESRDNPYTIVVLARDITAESSKITVTITATNVQEAGSITLSPAGTPKTGTPITATLSDPDGGVSQVRWRWQRSTDGVTWTNMDNADSASYLPTVDDAGWVLRAAVTYNDAAGDGVSIQGGPTGAVPEAPEPLPTPTPIPVATPSPTPVATPEPTVPPTMPPTPDPTPIPTATPAPTPTPVPTPIPAAESPPPTATPVHPATLLIPPPPIKPTSTPVTVSTGPKPTPSTAPTSTPVTSPTAAPEPTSTALPPTPRTIDNGGSPVWVTAALVAGVILVLTGLGFIAAGRLRGRSPN